MTVTRVASSLLLACFLAGGFGCAAGRCVSGRVSGQVCAELWVENPGGFRRDLLAQRRADCGAARPDACLEAAVMELGGLPFRDEGGRLDLNRVVFDESPPWRPARGRDRRAPPLVVPSVPPLPRPSNEAIDRALPLLVQVCESKPQGQVQALACGVLDEGAGNFWLSVDRRSRSSPYQARMPVGWLKQPRPEVVAATQAAKRAREEEEQAINERAFAQAMARLREASATWDRLEAAYDVFSFATGKDAQRLDDEVRPVLVPLWQGAMEQARLERQGLRVVAQGAPKGVRWAGRRAACSTTGAASASAT